MYFDNLNLTPERRKRLELDLNDLYEDYTDTMSRLQKEAANSVSGLVWDGESQELVRQEVNRYADAANKLASDYYSNVRDLWARYGEVDMPEFTPPTITADRAVWQMEGGFNNTDFTGLHYRDVIPDENGVVRNRAGKTIDELWPTFADADDAYGYVSDMMQTVGRLTMQRSVAIDPTKPRWARVPRGAKTCAFCLMLASRGFAYLSEDSAGRQMQYHADCDCDIMPSWGGAKLKGYDPDVYAEMYEAAEAAAGENGDWHDTLAQLRRIYPDEVKDGVTANPSIRWSHAPIKPTEDELKRLADYSVRKPGDKYTERQKIEALRGWTGDNYELINGYLFGNNSDADAALEQIEIIDEAINDHNTRRQFTVDRLMMTSFFKIDSISELPSVPIGLVLDHGGYMACSVDVGGKVAGEGERIAARILVPPGSSGVYLEPITQNPDEHEILIARGKRLVYEGFGKLQGGSPVAYLRLI